MRLGSNVPCLCTSSFFDLSSHVSWRFWSTITTLNTEHSINGVVCRAKIARDFNKCLKRPPKVTRKSWSWKARYLPPAPLSQLSFPRGVVTCPAKTYRKETTEHSLKQITRQRRTHGLDKHSIKACCSCSSALWFFRRQLFCASMHISRLFQNSR